MPRLLSNSNLASAFKGAWAGSTAYTAGQIVSYSGQSWIVTASHTSPSTFDGVNLSLLAQRGNSELLYQSKATDTALTAAYTGPPGILTGTVDGGTSGKTCVFEAWCANTTHATALSLVVSRLLLDTTTQIASCTNQVAGANGGGGPVVIRKRLAISSGTHQLDFQALSSPTGGTLKASATVGELFMRVVEV